MSSPSFLMCFHIPSIKSLEFVGGICSSTSIEVTISYVPSDVSLSVTSSVKNFVLSVHIARANEMAFLEVSVPKSDLFLKICSLS